MVIEYYAVNRNNGGYKIRKVNYTRNTEYYLSKTKEDHPWIVRMGTEHEAKIKGYSWYRSSIYSDWSVTKMRSDRVIKIKKHEIEKYLMLGQLKK